ncbi:MAG: hypothetical protein FJ137_03175 [Deltaproteobacteria bacterium]|nr:hypothetical protein [Deltaproteobacteria bacterium]
MKRLALMLPTLAVALVAACTSSLDQLCLERATRSGEEDPAAACEDAEEDLSEDEQALRDACNAEYEAFAGCFLDDAACQDFGPVKVFAPGAEDACSAEGEALTDRTEANG